MKSRGRLVGSLVVFFGAASACSNNDAGALTAGGSAETGGHAGTSVAGSNQSGSNEPGGGATGGTAILTGGAGGSAGAADDTQDAETSGAGASGGAGSAGRNAVDAGKMDASAGTDKPGPDAKASDAPPHAGLIHPGALFIESDLERIRSNVAAGREPWASAWTALQKGASEGANYQPSVKPAITNSNPDEYLIQNQGHAAYVLAMKWVASGDMAYATAAKRVLDAWANTVTSMDTTTLRTGVGATQFANAAEIIAHGFNGSAGWPPQQVAKAQTWVKTVLWSRIGDKNAQRSSNWGTSAMSGCMSAAIFADDQAKYDYTVAAYKNGFTDAPDGCSGVTQYICTAAGQPTEAGRDQGHAQGGVAHLVEVALMAWNQGLDLVSYADNRVLKGSEYLAKFNLGNDDVPYDPNFPDPCNVHPSWAVISQSLRGQWSPVYEAANRLFTLANVPHPYTAQVLTTPGYVPEFTNSDHCGAGTLMFR